MKDSDAEDGIQIVARYPIFGSIRKAIENGVLDIIRNIYGKYGIYFHTINSDILLSNSQESFI